MSKSAGTQTRAPASAASGTAPLAARSTHPRVLQSTLQALQLQSMLDPRLPVDRAAAIALAKESKQAIDAANAHLTSAAEARLRNVPAYIAQQGFKLAALTPRHDSSTTQGQIRFFAGQVDYSESVTLPTDTSHHVDAARRNVSIRARKHDDVSVLLAESEIAERVVQAVTEVAHVSAARRGAPDLFEVYRAEFNALWNVAEFTSVSTAFDPRLNSQGPRMRRAREIFERIYASNAALRHAYNTNLGGIRERIDIYAGPESFNPINSPRLQKLRDVFLSARAPMSNAAYSKFLAGVKAAARNLDDADREAVDNSADWQRLINAHVLTDDRRAELRTIIRTPPPTIAPPAAAVPPPAGPRQVVTPETSFVDGITITGPTTPIVANKSRAQVTLIPHSTVPNPGVAIATRFTVTPANRVVGENVSIDSPWPAGALVGTPFSPEISNSSTVTMRAHLDVVNAPDGLAPASPIPDFMFTVEDRRREHFVANWRAAVTYRVGTHMQVSEPGAPPPRYQHGAQTFQVYTSLSDGETNPGLTLFVRAQLKRSAIVVAAPSALEPFGPADSLTAPIPMSFFAPATTPVDGDPLTVEAQLVDADRSTVLSTKTFDMKVLPEQTYTKAQAIAQAVADDAYLHDASPSGLLGKMLAKGGAYASAAASAMAAQEPKLTIAPLSVRHDSREYVAAVEGAPNPEKVGYFVGTTYGDTAPDPDHSLVHYRASGMRVDGFGPRFIAVGVTEAIGATPTVRRADSVLIEILMHEAVHAMDLPSELDSDSPWDSYETEMRAYGMDGYGASGCQDTGIQPQLPPPGPKSCRARAIFLHLYGSPVYPWVKAAYDNNTDGFRELVDNYHIPDGINLIASRRLESLRELIEGFSGRDFAAFRARLRGFMAIGATPGVGVLTPDELREIANNRAWRDLVERRIPKSQWDLIKDDLGIPRPRNIP